MGPEHDRLRLKNLIHEIEKELPFTALGLFRVDLTTLISIFSTAMTYLIIMVQFYDAEKTNDARTTEEPIEVPSTVP